jgi:preprotein translocase subunit SecD
MIEHYEESAVDTSAESATDAAADTLLDISALLEEEAQAGNALLEVMQPVGQGVVYGAVAENDTAAANTLLRAPEIRALLPSGIKLMYTSSPIGLTEDGHEMYYILGVRDDIEMTGEVIEDARVDFDQITNAPEVTMVMNSEGARTWARLTGANVGKQVAIVLDGVVYSYPVVNERITGGRSAISGLDSQEEAQDIVTILKSGALPAPVEIVEERTVGPSLGQASIRAGFLSVMVGLLIVALFMIAYYRTGGVVADLALVLNIIFILGILAGFGATLTLPGIAGIVLTIGMAVDANVLIFERIREEQATGKTLKAAIDGGFAKALSAIIDANITTFFVGAILYSFGVGPIQGFAVTLMAGILASMFSAIVFTRIIFDYMVIERRLSVNYG